MDGHPVNAAVDSRTPSLHTHEFRLSYADTDPAGIVYYGAWLPRMEAVQSEWLLLNGFRQDKLRENFGWWTVSRAAQCEYLLATGLFDEIRLEMRLGHVGNSSFRFEFEMWRRSDEALVARGANTIVTVSPNQLTVPIPAPLRVALESWTAATTK
jgi:acyl-CoA thioester hydrolase